MKNLKQIIVVLLLVASGLLQAQGIKDGQITRNVNGLNISIDKRMEMLSVIQYLAESRMVTLDKIIYVDNVRKYFEPFKNHKVVSLYKEMEAYGFGYDAPVRMMLFLDSDFKIIKKIDKQTTERAPSVEKLDEFIKQLQDFNIKTNFDKFFSENYAILNKSIEMLIDSSFKNFDEIKTIEKFYGYKQNSYNIILAALFAGGYGPRIDAGNGKFDTYDIQGAWERPIKNIPFFGDEETFKQVVWHEFGHSFVNPLVDKYYKEFEKYKKLEEPIFNVMKSQAYGEWKIILYEHIVRSLTTVLCYEKYGKEKAENELERQRARGFIYIDSLYSKILSYAQHRDGKNFKQFFPEIINVIKYYSENPIDFKYFPTPNEMFSEKEDCIFIYSTNETTDTLNKLIKRYVEGINSNFYKLPVGRIIPDTIAMKRNLKNYSIRCYGSINGNLWLKSKIKNLPIGVFQNKIIALETYNQKNLRLICTWENPDNPEKNMIIYTSQNSEQCLDLNSVFHGSKNWAIANEKFEIIAEGNYKYSKGKVYLK